MHSICTMRWWLIHFFEHDCDVKRRRRRRKTVKTHTNAIVRPCPCCNKTTTKKCMRCNENNPTSQAATNNFTIQFSRAQPTLENVKRQWTTNRPTISSSSSNQKLVTLEEEMSDFKKISYAPKSISESMYYILG